MNEYSVLIVIITHYSYHYQNTKKESFMIILEICHYISVEVWAK